MSVDEPAFIDTNLLVYSVDPRDPQKYESAREWVRLLWDTGRGRISFQVLHEFYSVATRKRGIDPAIARRYVRTLKQWNGSDRSFVVIERAWHWMDHAHISYWDALIVAAAEGAGCRWLLSEDMQHGRQFAALTVVDPFRTAPAELGFPIPE